VSSRAAATAAEAAAGPAVSRVAKGRVALLVAPASSRSEDSAAEVGLDRHSSALTEGSGPQRKAVLGYTARRADPEVLGRPRTGAR